MATENTEEIYSLGNLGVGTATLDASAAFTGGIDHLFFAAADDRCGTRRHDLHRRDGHLNCMHRLWSLTSSMQC